MTILLLHYRRPTEITRYQFKNDASYCLGYQALVFKLNLPSYFLRIRANQVNTDLNESIEIEANYLMPAICKLRQQTLIICWKKKNTTINNRSTGVNWEVLYKVNSRYRKSSLYRIYQFPLVSES